MSADIPYVAADAAPISDETILEILMGDIFNVAAGPAPIPNETLPASSAAEGFFPITPDAEPITDWTPPASPVAESFFPITFDDDAFTNWTPPFSPTINGLSQIAADAAPISDETLLQSLMEDSLNVAAGPAPIPNETLPASSAAESFFPITPDAEPITNWTPPASSAAESLFPITPDAGQITNWTPPFNPTTNGLSQTAADSTPIPSQIPPMNFATSGANIVYYIGELALNKQQFHEYMLTLPDGPERVEIQKLYIRGKKHFCYEIKADIDLIKNMGLYEDAKASLDPVLEKAEANLLQWGMSEDILTNDPRAKALAKIARTWGAYVGDYFRRSSEREHSLRAVASAAKSVPNYTIARRLVNENILTRLEKVTGSQYRRKRYATIPDWYGIRGMAPIHEPIDSSRLFVLGLHLGEFDVLEEGIV